MIKYVPTSNLAVALELSNSLWALTRPTNIRDPKDTSYLFGTKTMADGSIWMVVDTDFTIPVHIDADSSPIIDILQPFVGSNNITAQELSSISNIVASSKGQKLNVWQSFPAYWKNLAKTREQLISAGLINELI
jgi:hypothetical protein